MDLPDIHQIPKFHSEDVVEILFSRKNNYRAIITKTRQGTFHVIREKWDLSDWDFIGKGYWNQNDQFKTLTDRLETARQLAREKLTETSEGLDTD
jgi:hypothetical protein